MMTHEPTDMKDGMTKEQKLFCSTVKEFYTDELVYHEQFMPKPDSMNQVYFPVCLHHLDVDGLMKYLKSESVTPDKLEWLSFTLFMKDQPTVFSLLS